MRGYRRPGRRFPWWLLAVAPVAAVIVALSPKITGAELRVVLPPPTQTLGPVKTPPPLPPGAQRLPKAMQSEVIAAVKDAAATWGLDPALIYSVITTESDWNPFAVSSAGAIGLMQVEPETANEIAGLAYSLRGTPAGFLYDPGWNVRLGAAYLALLLRTTNDLNRALSAYNDGDPTHVTPYAGAVLSHYQTYALWEKAVQAGAVN